MERRPSTTLRSDPHPYQGHVQAKHCCRGTLRLPGPPIDGRRHARGWHRWGPTPAATERGGFAGGRGRDQQRLQSVPPANRLSTAWTPGGGTLGSRTASSNTLRYPTAISAAPPRSRKGVFALFAVRSRRNSGSFAKASDSGGYFSRLPRVERAAPHSTATSGRLVALLAQSIGLASRHGFQQRHSKALEQEREDKGPARKRRALSSSSST